MDRVQAVLPRRGISKKVITVGSCDDQFYMEEGKKKRKSYSGRGPTAECVVKPDLLAPGSYITSCNAKIQRKKDRNRIQ